MITTMPPTRRRQSRTGLFDLATFQQLAEPLDVRLESREGSKTSVLPLEPGSLSNSDVPGNGYSKDDVLRLEQDLGEYFGPGSYQISLLDTEGNTMAWVTSPSEERGSPPVRPSNPPRRESPVRRYRYRDYDDYEPDDRWRRRSRYYDPPQQQQQTSQSAEVAAVIARMEQKIQATELQAQARAQQAQFEKLLETAERRHQEEIRMMRDQLEKVKDTKPSEVDSMSKLVLQALPIIAPLLLDRNKGNSATEEMLRNELRELKGTLEKQRDQAALDGLNQSWRTELDGVKNLLAQNGDHKQAEILRFMMESANRSSAEQLAAMSKNQITPTEMVQLLATLQQQNKPSVEPLEMMVGLLDIMERLGPSSSPITEILGTLGGLAGQAFQSKAQVEVAKASAAGGPTVQPIPQQALNGPPQEMPTQPVTGSPIEAKVLELVQRLQQDATLYEETHPDWTEAEEAPEEPGLSPWDAAEKVAEAASQLKIAGPAAGQIGVGLLTLFEDQRFGDMVDHLLPKSSEPYKATFVQHLEEMANAQTATN